MWKNTNKWSNTFLKIKLWEKNQGKIEVEINEWENKPQLLINSKSKSLEKIGRK